ncbi:exonuclease domain-containing protein [Flavihumibacter profundi]|uniref:exonuclease domain-containing protein n=1 Tax=Flavihumibacter profundi TaxID=2716883 RepID=UPI001CC662C0|nr:exonuclease domain-containing protein [Flavihumibacter profundi]MBZ5856354.1 GIY-YIG nuclease family protein [Flavihumibacter profundi]
MYAIVDIETTGGFAANHGITEIAILLHNGVEIEGAYKTLINPGQLIPRYISALTGITNEMVENAPRFEEVAEKVHALLSNRVFVAHNVNFDFSFIKSNLENSGYALAVKKLCTVRLARKIFTGLPSYSLGNLCRSLGIPIENRHRAEGDAAATAILFTRMLQEDKQQVISKMLKGKNAEQYLPPHLPADVLQKMPSAPGVYYFENQKKEVIYVGKAVNLVKRVKSHFSNNDNSKRRQELLRQVHHIRFQVCSSELMALILESQEIRRLWPLFNRSQKKYHHKYGLYTYEDSRGYLQLVIDKKKNHLPAIYTFDWLPEGQSYIRKLRGNAGTELVEEPAEEYNARINEAISNLQGQLPSFALVENTDRSGNQCAVYIMEKGRFYGMGFIEKPFTLPLSLESWRQKISPSPDNDYIRGLLYQFAAKKNFTRLDLKDELH